MSIVLIAVLLLVTLSSCISSRNTTPTLTVGNVQPIKGVVDGVEADLNSLSSNELSQLANMMVSAYSKDFDPREMLVAAKRGYDMTDPNFDKTVERPDLGTPNLAAALNVINLANTKASESARVPNLPKAINEYDLQVLINAFKTTVNLESDGGAIDTLLGWIGKFLNWMTNTLCFGSYLAGICLFAVIIEILMLPFAIKQQKNSIKQAMLRPKEMAIRKKYAGRNDQVTMQKMQQEIQEFYQKENFSPFSGCLPLLIQMPIILALYNIVIDPLHYVLGQANTLSAAINSYYTAAKAAGGLGGTLSETGTIALLSRIRETGAAGIESLKSFEYFTNSESIFGALNGIVDRIPNFNIGNINFGLKPSFDTMSLLLLVPVLTFVTYFLTSKINRKLTYQTATNGADDRQVACSNSIMDITMPAMSTVFTFMVPALIGIYWIFRSLVGMAKQFIIARLMPLPKFTEADYKAAEKEMAGKKVVKKSENVGKVRSLHYIDDEDFEDTRERAMKRKAAIEEREREEEEKKSKKTPFEAAPVKEDKPEKKDDADDTTN